MKRYLSIIIAVALVLSISCYAVSTRAVDVYPSLTYNGTQATCKATIMGQSTTDSIAATMYLYRGSTLIDSWSASGTGILRMEENATVSRNKTYTLTVYYSVNGIAQDPVTISRTN